MMNLHGSDHIGYIKVYFGVVPDSPEGGKAEGAAAAPPGTRSDSRYYYLKDHLGNVKVTVDKFGAVAAYDACPLDESSRRPSFWRDYDPYGMTLEGRGGVIGTLDTRYKFTGKERDIETGYDYFGARYYEARRKPTARTQNT